MRLFLVRHGRPLIDAESPASRWELDPAAADEVLALANRVPTPEDARWYSSGEPKAMATARLLSGDRFEVVEEFAEHRRPAGWVTDFPATVQKAFAEPGLPAHPGWEPLAACRARLLRAVDPLLTQDKDLVLVGHGTAWTLLAAALTGTEPDLERWRGLQMPDLIEVDVKPR